MLLLQDGGLTQANYLSVLGCGPSGQIGIGAIEADTAMTFVFSQNNFTDCYARESSAFCGNKDSSLDQSSSYLNMYGCSGSGAFLYESAGKTLTTDHNHFYNNTATGNSGTIHAREHGTINVDWSVVQGNTRNIAGNGQTFISHCVFDKEIPSGVIDKGTNVMDAHASSWPLYEDITITCLIFNPVPTLMFTQSENLSESLPVERSLLRESGLLNLSELGRIMPSQ
jgi:hypothetical protein